MYQFKGEQYRIYNFPGTGESIPYRLFVPARWNANTELPMLVTLRAGNTVDGPYRAQNDLVTLHEWKLGQLYALKEWMATVAKGVAALDVLLADGKITNDEYATKRKEIETAA